MKLLFISRAYPPVVGGIENQNYELSMNLPKVVNTTLLVNTRGKKFLPFFLPYALLKTLFSARQYDAILLGDGVLSIIGFFVKIFSCKTTVISIVHGLDITYRSPIYQTLWVRLFLPSLDGLIAVSKETKNIAVQHGLTEAKITVIANGVTLLHQPERYQKADRDTLLGFDTADTILLLTHGRLAKRKGAAWFIENVLPSLPGNVHYVISGSGPEKETIQKTIESLDLTHRVHLLGRVSDEQKIALLHITDIFIQPNIRVPGDMEGFGIAVIEASSCGLPVVASNLEGLTDALANGKNGILVEPENSRDWIDTLIPLIREKNSRKELGLKGLLYTQKHFAWETLTQKYIDTIRGFQKNG